MNIQSACSLPWTIRRDAIAAMGIPFTAIYRGVGLLVGLLATCALPARAFDYQLHGFAAQGYSVSQGNNYFGDSRHGSSDFYELGLNGTAALLPYLLVSSQGVLRRAGAGDTQGLQLDYAQLDWRAWSSGQANAGLRVGRVKNTFGFYNDTRDVIFTRPGITLPNSVYFESSGLRSVLFARDGAQLYGDLQLGEHVLSLTANANLDFNLNAREKLDLNGGQSLVNRMRVDNFYLARLQDDWNGGAVKVAASYLHAGISIRPVPQSPIEARESASLWVFSSRYDGSQFSLIGEYTIQFVAGNSNVAPPMHNASDGFYLQGDWRFLKNWTATLRYDASFSNRHDRDGRDFAAQTGGDRYGQFTHDEMVGVHWLPTPHWGLWAEFHLMQGNSNLQALDNAGRTPADHSNLFQVMAAYRF